VVTAPETTADKEIAMFSPIPAETLLRSHLDEARRYHRHLQQIAEIRKTPRSGRRLR
jgi:hypothetical protein